MALQTALMKPEAYPHAASPRLFETHISLVYLTGEYAYKVKKPRDLGFLDFSSLEKRHHYCCEELRLNRRFAPKLYLDVVPIHRLSDDVFRVGGDQGEIVDYAVQMRQFPDNDVLSLRAQTGLDLAMMQRFGQRWAALQQGLPTAPGEDVDRNGIPSRWRDAMVQNFQQIRAYLRAPVDVAMLNALEDWSMRRWREQEVQLWNRYEAGWVREGHGDLHLGNLVVVEEDVVAFDAVEFNAAFRWSDLMNEYAFLLMDCLFRQVGDAGFAALNASIEHSGDYAGIGLLPDFLVYRAMVRAKVALFSGPIEVKPDEERYLNWQRHAILAESVMQPQSPTLILMCGVSGSGKSQLAEQLVPALSAFRVRSDVERKRLFGLQPDQRATATNAEDLYGVDASRRTFDRLAEISEIVLRAGFNLIVDATFTLRAHRHRFREIAERMGARCVVVYCDAEWPVLRSRVNTRFQAGRDASDADQSVLEQQLRSLEAPLDEPAVVIVRTDQPEPLTNALAGIHQALS